MTLRLGCIADDFTGATDAAALIARGGAAVLLHIGVPAVGARPENATAGTVEAPFEVVALKCRTIAPEEAVRQTREAARYLLARGAERLYWKYCSTFDSTPRGNIGPVAEALLAELGSPTTLHCPAFPENGRTVYGGQLFVDETPLADSPMRDHPLTPMRDSDLVRLLAPQTSGRVARVTLGDVRSEEALGARLDAAREGGVAHLVVDAIEDGDLERIARAAVDWPLLCGGSALAREVAARLVAARPDEGSAGPEAPAARGTLVLSGSCSAMTRRQVARHAERHPSLALDAIACHESPAATRGEARRWLEARRRENPDGGVPMIYASAAPEVVREAQEKLGRERAGAAVEAMLAALARDAVDLGYRRLVVAGGESSGAVAAALGISRLRVGREIAPGVPWTFAERAGERVALALKSGNFGDEDFFASAAGALDGG